ncbi:hypothetical protein [Bosea sp. (in: a-proteobacteria)]|uniref:hypothetical protein n=1 Tax=Bosea sp. (in: a-proteobacteria) TaxID=1871050 RepID=UPI002DDD6E21|nr:hypothetical protein [Bosea sp. (in: a-proteobacteria)]HEV2512285.1 hypothetical protein [Bosea sp. (in: a-proteobacteria)]
MTAESVCFAALPAALPAALAQANAGEDVTHHRLALSEASGVDAREVDASFLAPRLLPRLFRDPAQAASQAQATLLGAARLIVLLPVGRYDDGVWAPIIERILSGLEAAAARPREIILAWSGVEPFLAPFGRRAQEVWNDPRLVPAMLGVLERSARSLPAVLDTAANVRRGLIRFEPAQDAGPARAALALA